MTTALLSKPEEPLLDREPPIAPTGRTPRRPWLWSAVVAGTATIALIGAMIAATAGAGPTSVRDRMCADGAVIPCAVPSSDRGAMTAAIAQVLGIGAGQIALDDASGILTGSAGEFALTPGSLAGTDHFGWTYSGSEERLGYLGVQTTRGTVVVGITGLRTGTVDLTAVLPGATVTGVQFWFTKALFTAPVAATRLHGTGFLGNSMIGRITNGTVPCVQSETAIPGRCAFHRESSSWLESIDGDWALAGQPTSPTGEPGDWVIASKVNANGTYPALMPAGHDTTGAPSGIPAAGGAVNEKALSSSNASGWPMMNNATLDVCSNAPGPDVNSGGRFTGSPSPGVYCYTGLGAGLNDPSGTERDEYGVYRPDTHNRHLIQVSSSTLIIAAKRPATTATPGVNQNSPVVWRPVVNMPIANS